MSIPKQLADALAKRAQELDFSKCRVYELTFEDAAKVQVICRNPPGIEKKIEFDDETGNTTPSYWATYAPIYQKVRADKVLSIKEVMFGVECEDDEGGE